MDKYNIKIYTRAYHELDEIYAYIAENLVAPETAERKQDGAGEMKDAEEKN